MATGIQVSVGPVSAADGSQPLARASRDSSVVTQDAHGRYQEAVSRRGVFSAANQAAVALSVAGNATATGLILCNPIGNAYAFAILDVCVALATAPAGAATLGLWMNNAPGGAAVTHTAAVVGGPTSALVGSSYASTAKVDTSSTLPATATLLRPIGGGPVGASTLNTAFIRDEVSGLIILMPGCTLHVSALTTAISAVVGYTWEEILATQWL